MTHRLDVADGREIVARWCILAEQRLEHLSELFETGRWRRYHSERAFLENIREAKAAVESWRMLVRGEGARDNSAIDYSWLGRGAKSAPLPRHEPASPDPVQLMPQGSAEPQPTDVLIEPTDRQVCSADAPFAPAIDAAGRLTPDVAMMQERYPSLRNAL